MQPASRGKWLAVHIGPGGAIDLPADMQRELRELEDRGTRLTHYELLGVPADADGAAIRRAYLEKSKRFHRDARELDPKRSEIANKLIELERAQLKALAH